MLNTDRQLYVGFMHQQTLEKSMTDVLVSRKLGKELPYIHKPTMLANLSRILKKMSEDQLHFLGTVNPLNIEACYPLCEELFLEL